ncbi:hypothetical protein RND81_06G029600 [Saponaria officinalis]|uniref:Uncharacterized protein n=1 Tax=Saponaria officinalis TaxID=3572 RepID=A0AAW1K616_SAPOF
MSVSLEALAMAGEDYVNFGMKMEEWERVEVEETPDHLMAYEDDDEYEEPWFLPRISNANNDGVNDDVVDEDCGKCEGFRRLRRLLIMIMAICKLIMIIRVKRQC